MGGAAGRVGRRGGISKGRGYGVGAPTRGGMTWRVPELDGARMRWPLRVAERMGVTRWLAVAWWLRATG